MGAVDLLLASDVNPSSVLGGSSSMTVALMAALAAHAGRPVAPVVLEEEVPNWFVGGASSPYMLFVFNERPDKAHLIPAVRHVDGTARIQTTSRTQHPLYYDLVRAFGARTGVPVLVNTSFNTRGEPIACSPPDAIECFWSSPLDALAIGLFLFAKGMTLRASVVVPTHGRPASLRRCLHALMAQDVDPATYEIVVVDDGASSESRCAVMACARSAARRGLAIRYLSRPQWRGPAAARNAGWLAASGEVIAFTDDDCVPLPGWLKAGVWACERGAEGASGRVVVPLPCHPTDYQRNTAGLADAEFVTASCFYRRRTLIEVNGFDTRFEAPWREDSDLYFTLLERGASLCHVPDAIVVHPVRPARWDISVAQQRRSVYNALLFKKHPRLYRSRIQRTPPRDYYAVLAALAVALVAALRGRPKAAWCGLGLWAILTTRFCLRRLRGTSHAPLHVLEMAITSAIIPPLAVFWRLAGAVRFRVLFL